MDWTPRTSFPTVNLSLAILIYLVYKLYKIIRYEFPININ